VADGVGVADMGAGVAIPADATLAVAVSAIGGQTLTIGHVLACTKLIELPMTHANNT